MSITMDEEIKRWTARRKSAQEILVKIQSGEWAGSGCGARCEPGLECVSRSSAFTKRPPTSPAAYIKVKEPKLHCSSISIHTWFHTPFSPPSAPRDDQRCHRLGSP